jgi:hypothetical protein
MGKYCFQFICLGLLLALVGCKTTNQITFNSLEPAPVDLSNAIKKIGIINETETLGKSEYRNQLDRIVSMKDQQLEKVGKDAAIHGLYGELLKDKRFDTVLLLDNAPDLIKGAAAVPLEIPWPAIEKLCDRYAVDAIFSLALYETDTRVTTKKSSMEELDLMRVKVKVPAHEVTLETLIENGWKIYDPYNKKIIDEITFNDQITASAKGSNPFRALEAIENRKDSVLDRSRSKGSAYGLRLKPYNKKIQRNYYVKGTINFEKAEELVLEEDWKGATILWLNEIKNPKPKIKAMACFNLAVLNEMQGNLPTAIEWAIQSDMLHKNKTTTAYLEALKHRSTQNQLAEQQLASFAMLKMD